jgi:hypothetical protein
VLDRQNKNPSLFFFAVKNHILNIGGDIGERTYAGALFPFCFGFVEQKPSGSLCIGFNFIIVRKQNS